MGRAYYRFGHDIALRLADGQAFALKNAELGARFAAEESPSCFLRGSFTTGSYRGLIARGLLPPNPQLQALTVPVTVQLNLKAELAATVGKDAAMLQLIGRRIDQNSKTDELARKLLMFEMWQVVSVAPFGQVARHFATPNTPDPQQEAVISEMVTGLASELWLAAEEAGEAAQSPSLEAPMPIEDAVKLFFEEEEWGWEAVTGVEGLLRTVYDGQNGSWMCYTRILPDLDQVIFYSVCPVSVPALTLSTMTEFLCRTNADLSLGNFEIDFSQSSVRFRTSVDVTDVGLSPLLFRNLAFHNLAVMDIYLPEVMRIIAGAKSANPDAE